VPAKGASLSVDGVTYRYGRAAAQRGPARPALDDVSFEVRPGETLALVGESGSGKSTLARIIAGLSSAQDGQVRFAGTALPSAVERRPKELQRAIQIIFQNPDGSLNGRHRIGAILERPLALFFGLDAAQRRAEVGRLLEAVQLPADYVRRFPSEISGGERQRVAIARALAARPELLLCDEIISALDVSVQAAVLDLLASLQKQTHLTMLFIAHDLAVVRWFADRVVVLYRGQVCETAPTAELFAPPYHPYTALLLQAAPQFGKRAQSLAQPVEANEPVAGETGCVFAGTCRHAIAGQCNVAPPPWRTVAPGHAIRCHLDPALLAQLEQSASTILATEIP
jgi:peptide/nickel transport system ATP-binding protein